MKNKKMIHFTGLITWILLFAMFLAPCSKAFVLAEEVIINQDMEYDVVIEDAANLLSDEEREELIEAMKPVAEYGHVAFITTLQNPGTAEAYCHKVYDRYWGADPVSAAVFLVDMDNRYVRLQCDGYIYSIVDDNYCDTITDNVFKYAREGDFYSCAEQAFVQVGTLLSGQRIAQPMKYISNALLALISAVLLMFLYVRIVTRQKAPSDDEMLNYIIYHCDIEEPKKKYLGKKKIESTSSGGGIFFGSSGSSSDGYSSGSSSSSWSSGSSSSSRSSGSSHSSGGGGQHRF